MERQEKLKFYNLGNSDNEVFKKSTVLSIDEDILPTNSFREQSVSPYETILPSVKHPSKEFCGDCNFWKNHANGSPLQHKSCICELFSHQAICCLEGYSNLMTQIPHIILYAPTPNKYIFHSYDPYTYPIQINSHQVIEIVNFCNNLRLNIIPKLQFPYKNKFVSVIKTSDNERKYGDS